MLRKIVAVRGMVTDGWVALDAADLGLIESVYKKTIREGEERLMLAVLEEAVQCFQEYVLSTRPREKRLFQEAEEWFLNKDSDYVFSFENICETLQLHPNYIRHGLLLWKEARLKTPSVEFHSQSRTKSLSNRMRHASVRLSNTA
jgi:hypothetical protein